MKGHLRTAERALLLHHLLGNLHIHDARAAGEEEPPGGSSHIARGGVRRGAPGTPGRRPRRCLRRRSVPGRAFANLEALHAHVRAFPEGTVAEHDVAIVQTLVDELKCACPAAAGGGGGEGGGVRARRRRRRRPPVHEDDAPIVAML